MPSDEQISLHFTLAEFTDSDTAAQQGIDNTPDPAARDEIERLAAVLEGVRAVLGNLAVEVTSGFRSTALNAAVGGAPDSAHRYGRAADFVVPAFGSPRDICHAIEPYMRALQIDQLIYEADGWVHLGLAPLLQAPRYQTLTITSAGTTTPGIG
jgi:zinc D-Ala-D-Ala carboxypeptidase